MNTCENHDGASNGDKHEEEEEAVCHAEKGKGQVVIILDPMVAAAEEAERD